MDFLNLVVSLHERMGVDIPEADYPEMLTIDGAVAYLVEALRKPPKAAKNSSERGDSTLTGYGTRSAGPARGGWPG